METIIVTVVAAVFLLIMGAIFLHLHGSLLERIRSLEEELLLIQQSALRARDEKTALNHTVEEVEQTVTKLVKGLNNEDEAYRLAEEYRELTGEECIWNITDNRFVLTSGNNNNIYSSYTYYFQGNDVRGEYKVSHHKTFDEMIKLLTSLKAEKYSSCKKKGKCKDK